MLQYVRTQNTMSKAQMNVRQHKKIEKPKVFRTYQKYPQNGYVPEDLLCIFFSFLYFLNYCNLGFCEVCWCILWNVATFSDVYFLFLLVFFLWLCFVFVFFLSSVQCFFLFCTSGPLFIVLLWNCVANTLFSYERLYYIKLAFCLLTLLIQLVMKWAHRTGNSMFFNNSLRAFKLMSGSKSSVMGQDSLNSHDTEHF